MFSIILITYNSEKYIQRALRSILNQLYNDFEVIIIDAGSSDSTKQKVLEFKGNIIFKELLNSTQGEARNFGMKISKGEYLCFLDSDDIYLDNALSIFRKYIIEYPDVDIFYASNYFFDERKNNVLGFQPLQKSKFSLIDYLNLKNNNLSTMCIRNYYHESYFRFGDNELGKYCEDWSFQFNLYNKNLNIFNIPTRVSIVTIRTDSHTSWNIQWKMKKIAFEFISDFLKNNFQSIPKADLKVIMRNFNLYNFKYAISILVANDEEVKNIKDNVYKNLTLYYFFIFKILAVMNKIFGKNFIINFWKIYQKRNFNYVYISKVTFKNILHL